MPKAPEVSARSLHDQDALRSLNGWIWCQEASARRWPLMVGRGGTEEGRTAAITDTGHLALQLASRTRKGLAGSGDGLPIGVQIESASLAASVLRRASEQYVGGYLEDYTLSARRTR
jgi:hypothetical protein